MKLVRQCKDSFIRRYNNIGYITNQLTKKDRVYNKIGAIFLDKINRHPILVNSIVNDIFSEFPEISRELIYSDFIEFLTELETDSFIVTGYSEKELDKKDFGFSYDRYNLRDISLNVLKEKKDISLSHTSEFLYKFFRENPTIFGSHIEVTSRCNEQCIHCYISHQDKNKNMELSLSIDVMDQLYEMGAVSMTFSGGEPFLHQNFPEILDHARKRDFSINILTNGTVISEELIEQMKNLNINRIQVSLYSMDSSIHDSITQLPGSHVKTLQSIKNLINNNIPVQVSCPIMKTNKNSYKNVAIWCKINRVRVLSDFILMAKSDFNTINLINRLDIDETKSVINEIIEVEDEYRALLELEPKSMDIQKFANKPVCGIGVDNACISFDGFLYPCAGFQGIILGNIRNQKIRDIWINSDKVNFLRSIKNSSFPQCIMCNAKDYCAMCLVRNHNENKGDMFKVNDHYCKVAFMTKELVKKIK